MPTHAEKRKMPYSAEQLFDLVAGVEKYPAFLPWCLECRVTRREGDVFYADLTIGFKMVREHFTSRVTALRPDHIHVEYLSGPMKYLSNHWRFLPEPDGGCVVDFFVDFEFRNPLLRGMIGAFFERAVTKMVEAFEKRAAALYGPQAALRSGSSFSPSKPG